MTGVIQNGLQVRSLKGFKQFSVFNILQTGYLRYKINLKDFGNEKK